MPNLLNTLVRKEYEDLLTQDLDALFVQPVGMSVADATAFRRKLRDAGLRMRLLKGNLAQGVLGERGLQDTGALFTGPAAIIVADDRAKVDAAAIAASKVLAAWRKDTKNRLPSLKGGALDGRYLDATAAAVLERMPGKAELRASIAAQIVAPGRRLSAQLLSGGGRIAGAVKTHIANLEKAG